jgi:hypothetical protein
MRRYHADPEDIEDISRYKRNFLMIPFCKITSHATLVVLPRGCISRSGGVQ